MRSILIVDDSKAAQMAVKMTLWRISDSSFMTAENGARALDFIQKQHVDLLVTDINMPGMDGLALVEAVRKLHDRRRLPILVITGKGQEVALDKSMALGADDYVLKPLDSRELYRRASRLLERQDPKAGAS